MADVVLARHAADAIRRGHPWVYAQGLRRGLDSARGPGFARLRGEDGAMLGVGVLDPGSPIALRVWALGERVRLDADLFEARLARAIAVRAALFGSAAAEGATTAYRLLNGEGDRTPGFVLDRYDDVAVLRLDGEGARAVAPELTRGIEAVLRRAGIATLLERESVRGQAPVVSARFGPERATVTVREHGVPFAVDLLHGQKTGAFLDQRENRKRIGDLVAARKAAGLGTRVLNLFSYTGGFSLRAALAGAVVTSVDVAAKAHATAQESFRLAGLDPRGHVFAAADAFAFLESAKKRGERWDVVISDPPSFAPSEKAKARALTAYRALHRACADVLEAGGTFVAASCSSHVGAEDFLTTLDDAALGRGDLRVLEIHGAPPDHPSLATFPEGRYLKLVVLA